MIENNFKIKTYSFTIDCLEPYKLAEFYANLLDWEIPFHDNDWACLCAPNTAQGAYPGITFQRNPDYKPPVWPCAPETQQQMAHLDFAVNDLEKAVNYAIELGAKEANEQFSDEWRVMIDPSGHPFCLCLLESLFESNDFALL